MTLEEICQKYGYSESSVLKQWTRTQEKIYNKYGVKIKKEGRGTKATYIEEKDEISDNRALTMFDETRTELVLNNESLSLINCDFLVFLGIVSTPMGMFRGTYEDFLKYIGAGVTKDNLEMLEDALLGLVDRELIVYDTDEDVIILYVKRKAEKEMSLGIEMIRHCRILAEVYHKHKRGWLNLFKVWVAVQICAEEQPFTMEKISKMTNLSKPQIRDAKKILERDELFRTSRAGRYFLCQGMNVDLNGFYN